MSLLYLSIVHVLLIYIMVYGMLYFNTTQARVRFRSPTMLSISLVIIYYVERIGWPAGRPCALDLGGGVARVTFVHACSLVPRPSRGEGKAWYALYLCAHAHNYSKREQWACPQNVIINFCACLKFVIIPVT